MIIDIHAHYIPRLLFERFDAEHAKFPSVTLKREDKANRLQFPGGEMTRPIMPKLSDLADRIAWMDRNGIDHQLVGGWLDSFGYELPAPEGLAWSRYINACMKEELVGQTRFTPLATVPLQDGKLAAQVLGEAMDAGFGGLMIGTLPKGPGRQPRRSGPRSFLAGGLRSQGGRVPAPDVPVRRAASGRLRPGECNRAGRRYLDRGCAPAALGTPAQVSGPEARDFAWGRRVALRARAPRAQLHDRAGQVCRSAQRLRSAVLRLDRVRPRCVRVPCRQGGGRERS